MSIETISFTDYRNRAGLNSHYLKDLLRNPAYAKYQRENQRDTPAFQFGRAFHAAVLEPAELLARFTVAPDDMDRRTKVGKATWEELQASGKTILTSDDMQRISNMTAALRQHETARKLLGEVTAVEQSVFWQMSGFECKARVDARAGARILDIKTTTDASKKAFTRHIIDYGYFIQAAHYLEGMLAQNEPVNEFVIIAVENTAPHGVAVYSIDQGFIDAGRAKIAEAMNLHRDCTASGRWPSYPEKVEPILCPAWLCQEEIA